MSRTGISGSVLVGAVLDAWEDVDRLLVDVEPEELLRKPSGGSSIAWSVAHLSNQLDGWLNVRFAGHPAHPVIGAARFRHGGDGTADDWNAIDGGIRDVRRRVATYLERLTEDDLRRVVPYDGAIEQARARGLRLDYALLRVVVHHYFHIGEIAGHLGSVGKPVGAFPGPLRQALASLD